VRLATAFVETDCIPRLFKRLQGYNVGAICQSEVTVPATVWLMMVAPFMNQR
jgi:hypothetical protein